MTCALAALAPKSILNDEEKRNNPDSNGGFEMGTWTFPKYLSFFDDIAGKECTKDKKYGSLTNNIEEYTPKAHEDIVKELKRVLEILPKGKLTNKLFSKEELHTLKAWCGVGRMPCYPKKNPLSLNHRKWYEKLLEIFESKEAVVYYI